MKNTLFPLEEMKKTFDYKKFEKEYKDLNSWGMLTSIDVKDCDPNIIKSYDHLKKFAINLCKEIKMRRFGDPTIIAFGEQSAVLGYSMTQFIETSLVSGHFANETNSGYIDIFSCKLYDPLKAAIFTQKFFEAKSALVGVVIRD
jgi:S-adenosylmethionine/arginine decarboxylase-like enzyme